MARVRGRARRDELTFRGNLGAGRHGWLRLTPAYAARVVDEILDRHEGGGRLRVLDPFSGTGTTALGAAARGHEALALELNPFLVWLCRAKVREYEPGSLEAASRAASATVRRARGRRPPRAPAPPIRNVSRWWPDDALDGLRALKGCLDAEAGEEGPARDLLLVAFCRTLIAASNAAFDHQSMSFADPGRAAAGPPPVERFAADVETVLEAASGPIPGRAHVLEGDAREVPAAWAGAVDLVVTSPPYPNRMSYVRELRPYMYWLGYLSGSREAGELDWRAIGGTWGVATSRVARWSPPPGAELPEGLAEPLARIARAEARSAPVLAAYVGRYFVDMASHLASVLPLVRPGGELHYVVGNSRFYDVLLPVEEILASMLRNAGARETEVVRLRKRTSKRELYELDVVART